MHLLQQLARNLIAETSGCRAEGFVVAFSGGADSTALLWGLRELAPDLGIELIAAHLDHGLDSDSPRRRAAAGRIADGLGVAFESERQPVRAEGGAGLEAEARRSRYAYLEAVRRRHGYDFIATAHHREDQAETVLLRMQFGSGPLGLAGIRRRDRRVVRPLLGTSRAELRRVAESLGSGWIDDPTNRDLARPRNRLRSHTMTALADDPCDLVHRLDGIARAASGARRAIQHRLWALLQPASEANGVSAALPVIRDLPTALLRPALAVLHARAGADYPPPGGAVDELRRQIAAERGIGCDCGAFWRWEGRGDRLHLVRREPEHTSFTYTHMLPRGDVSAPSPRLGSCPL